MEMEAPGNRPTRCPAQSCSQSIVIKDLNLKHSDKIQDFNPKDYTHSRRLFPSELDLIHLVYLEYSLDRQDKCIHDCQTRAEARDDKWIPVCVKYMDDHGWRLLETFQQTTNMKFLGQGQFAATFYNEVSKLLVIVHRGTELKNLDSLVADFGEVVRQTVGPFGCTAYLYTKTVVEKYGAGCESISVTGHSLGGWLAQVCTFNMLYPENLKMLDEELLRLEVKMDDVKAYGERNCTKLGLENLDKYRHLHCVSFDGPGCKEALQTLLLEPDRKYDDDRKFTAREWDKLDTLDVTVYFCPMDFTNIVNEQIGSVFHMKSDLIFRPETCPNKSSPWHKRAVSKLTGSIPAVEWYNRFVAPHKCDRILEFWRIYEYEIESITHITRLEARPKVLKLVNWFAVQNRREYMQAMSEQTPPDFDKYQERNFNEMRMSCLNPAERDMLEIALERKKCYSDDSIVDKTPASALTADLSVHCFSQILKIDRRPDNADPDLYRDYFIRRIKSQIKALVDQGVVITFPNYLESVYISRTAEFVKNKLPEFDSDSGTVSPLIHFVTTAFCKESYILAVNAPKEDVRLCTAELYSRFFKVERVKDPKRCLVLNTLHLARLDHIFQNPAMGGEFLPELKFVLIECASKFDTGLVNDWIQRLCLDVAPLNRPVERRIIVVLPSECSTDELGLKVSGSLGSQSLFVYTLQAEDVKGFWSRLNITKLVEHSKVEFKGRYIKLGQLIDPADSILKEPNVCQGLYKVLMTGSNTLARPLPKLSTYEDAYFMSRTYQDIEVKSFSKDEFMVFMCNNPDADDEQRNVVLAFIKDRTLHELHFGQSAELQSKLSRAVKEEHRSIWLHNANYSVIALAKSRLTELNASGHIVELRHYPVKGSEALGYKLVWLASFGKPVMSKLGVSGFGEFDYKKLVAENTRALTVIADRPGMGKTTIMQKLALLLQESSSSSDIVRWTILIKLAKAGPTILTELANKAVTLETVIHVLAAVEADNETERFVIAAYLKHLLREEDRVRIFLDGLDEVDEELQAIVLNMTEVLLKHDESKGKMFIASRKRLSGELKGRFKIPYYTLNLIEHTECIQFLINYWGNHKDFLGRWEKPVNLNLLKKYAESVVLEFKSKLGREASEFIGIPLQLRMLGDAFMHDPFFKFYERYVDSEESPDVSVLRQEKLLPNFTNIADLYRLFIETKIREGLREKVGIDVRSCHPFIRRLKLDETLLQLHKLAGFDRIFCFAERKLIHPPAMVSTDDRDGLHVCGIVEIYSPRSDDPEKSDESVFVHLSLAEYLAAEFIFDRLTPNVEENRAHPQLKSFLDSYLHLQQYDNVLKFLNMLVLNADSVFVPQLRIASDPHPNLEALVQFFRGHKEGRDRLGRNVMHYITMNSMSWLNRQCGLCEKWKRNYFLLEGRYLLSSKDLFDATPLAYVAASPRLPLRGNLNRERILLRLLLNDFMSHDSDITVDKWNSLSNTPTCTCPSMWATAQIFNKVRVCNFIEMNAVHLGDFHINLRRNISSINRDKYVLRITQIESIDQFVQLGLSLRGTSRIEFICELMNFWRTSTAGRQNLELLENALVGALRENGYAYYRTHSKHVQGMHDTDLLRLFADKEVPPAEVYQAWRDSDFVLLRKILYTNHNLTVKWFYQVYLHTPDHSDSLEMYEGVIRPWLDTTKPSVHADSEDTFLRTECKVLCVVPIVHRILSQTEFEIFVEKYGDLIYYSLSNEYDLVKAWGAYKDMFLNNLYSTTSGRRRLHESVRRYEVPKLKNWLREKEKEQNLAP